MDNVYSSQTQIDFHIKNSIKGGHLLLRAHLIRVLKHIVPKCAHQSYDGFRQASDHHFGLGCKLSKNWRSSSPIPVSLPGHRRSPNCTGTSGHRSLWKSWPHLQRIRLALSFACNSRALSISFFSHALQIIFFRP